MTERQAKAPSTETGTFKIPPWTSYLLLTVAFIVLTVWSWKKWPDILIDYGQQLYLPWQLASGKVLYRDVMYLTGGPFSQYFHALLFKSFGVSATTLIVANLCVLAGFIALLQWLFERATGRLAATSATLTALFTFVFAQLTLDGTFNFVCPYSYEATHGLILSVVAIACLWRWISNDRDVWVLAAGLSSGCVFLTKPDLFLALSAALATALFVRHTSSAGQGSFKPISLLTLGLAVPGAMVVAYYMVVWQAAAGLKATFAAWLPLFTTELARTPYYQWCLGLDHPVERLTVMGYHTVFLLLTIVLSAWLARTQRTQAAFWTLGFSLLCLLYGALTWPRWYNCGDALLPITCAGFVFVAWQWWRNRRSPEGGAWAFPLLWSVFALLLMAKMGLHPRIWHYGFYQALPAATFVVLLVLWWLPRELARFRVNPMIFRMLMICFWAVATWQLLLRSDYFYRQKQLAVGDGGDRLLTMTADFNLKGTGIKSALDWVNHNTSPTNTLAVFPEGIMLNYLARRVNPTPYTVVTPAEIQVYGGSTIAAAYAKNAPDYVVLADRSMIEFGQGGFGGQPGSGREILEWVHAHYTPAWSFDHEPVKSGDFHIAILRRNDLTPAAP